MPPSSFREDTAPLQYEGHRTVFPQITAVYIRLELWGERLWPSFRKHLLRSVSKEIFTGQDTWCIKLKKRINKAKQNKNDTDFYLQKERDTQRWRWTFQSTTVSNTLRRAGSINAIRSSVYVGEKRAHIMRPVFSVVLLCAASLWKKPRFVIFALCFWAPTIAYITSSVQPTKHELRYPQGGGR